MTQGHYFTAPILYHCHQDSYASYISVLTLELADSFLTFIGANLQLSVIYILRDVITSFFVFILNRVLDSTSYETTVTLNKVKTLSPGLNSTVNPFLIYLKRLKNQLLG